MEQVDAKAKRYLNKGWPPPLKHVIDGEDVLATLGMQFLTVRNN
ncbi:hypothetical protein [Paenibacillus sp. FSL K6-2524]